MQGLKEIKSVENENWILSLNLIEDNDSFFVYLRNKNFISKIFSSHIYVKISTANKKFDKIKKEFKI